MDGGEFVIMNKKGDNDESIFLAGGYKINSSLLSQGISPVTTYTGGDLFGKKTENSFENLAVPAGLYYVNQSIPTKIYKPQHYSYEDNHKMLSDDIHDKLFALIEVDNKRKRKTRKHFDKSPKSDKKKTRRNDFTI